MNWYRILTPHDTYTAQDVGRLVLMEGGAREAALEQMGYLRFVGVDSAPEFREVAKKKVRRGESGQDRSPEVEPVGQVSGDEPRS